MRRGVRLHPPSRAPRTAGAGRPYWVPVSCLAVVQGASLRMVWNRHTQRVLGTLAGLGLAWVLLELPLNVWGVVTVMIALSFVIEILMVRHYGRAVIFITPLAIFITPLTIFLAEAVQIEQLSPGDHAGAVVLSLTAHCPREHQTQA